MTVICKLGCRLCEVCCHSGSGPAAASLLLRPSSAATHPGVFDLVLKDSTVVHEIGYDLHLS